MGHRVRIAVSVIFGVLTVAMCVLWVASYWGPAGLSVWKTHGIRYDIASADGWLIFLRMQRIYLGFELFMVDPYSFIADSIARTKIGIGRYEDGQDLAVGVAYWLLVVVTLASGAMPWVPWRFGLRALLVATTLVAVALGVICYTVR